MRSPALHHRIEPAVLVGVEGVQPPVARRVVAEHRLHRAVGRRGAAAAPFLTPFLRGLSRRRVSNGVVNITTRTSHYERFTMSGTGYTLNNGLG